MKVKMKCLMIVIIGLILLIVFRNESFAEIPDYGEPGSYNTAFSIDIVCEALEDYEIDMSGDYGYETRVYSNKIKDKDLYVKMASLIDMGETIETASFGTLHYQGTEELVGRHCYIYTADITDKAIFDNKIVEDLRYPEYNFKLYYEISIKEVIEDNTDDEILEELNDLNIEVDVSDKEYTGKEIKTDVLIKDEDYILVEGIDYTVEYKDNKYPGVSHILISGINNYTGTIEKNFNITTIAKYAYNNDETITITGYDGGNKFIIPEYINGYEVTAIGMSAFHNCSELLSIEIPSSVTRIGQFAFRRL